MTDPLAQILDPRRSVLVVVDPQNDYCHPAGVLGRLGLDLAMVDPMIEAVKKLHATARSRGVPVIFIKTVHTDETDSPSWRRRHEGMDGLCREGTWGVEWYGLSPVEGDITVIKHRYSGFVGTRLENVLHTLGRNTLVFTGGATNVCVESTLRDAYHRDYETVLVEDASASTDRTAHEATLRNVNRFFGAVLPADGVHGYWHRAVV